MWDAGYCTELPGEKRLNQTVIYEEDHRQIKALIEVADIARRFFSVIYPEEFDQNYRELAKALEVLDATGFPLDRLPFLK